MSGFPTPHLEKLNATLVNEKLPSTDKPRLQAAIARYDAWIKDLDALSASSPEEKLVEMVRLLNTYRNSIDLDLVFDSEYDFLYRQKGQLKLDNSVIEEFLPRLVHPSVVPELGALGVSVGPAETFSAAYFASDLATVQPGGALAIRTKSQDFAIYRSLHIKASHQADFSQSLEKSTFICYVAAECKTNLDKTMFQEANATAHDVKSAVAGAKYFLLCEWLDMAPLSTAATDIEEVIILRKAKRINSNIRAKFSTSAGRQKCREEFKAYLDRNPFQVAMFRRFLEHIKKLVSNETTNEVEVLSVGYF